METISTISITYSILL